MKLLSRIVRMDLYHLYFVNEGRSVVKYDTVACIDDLNAIYIADCRLALTQYPGVEVWLDGACIYASPETL